MKVPNTKVKHMNFEDLEHAADNPRSGEDLGDKISELIETYGLEAVGQALKSREDQEDQENIPEPLH